MPYVTGTFKVELELAGRGNGWTDRTADVREGEPLVAEIGIRDSSPSVRVAAAGTLTLALDNSHLNLDGLLGRYSPAHANALPGFDIGTGIRVTLINGATERVRFVGEIKSITPTPGEWDERLVYITAADWLDQAARHTLTGLTVQENKRADELLTLIYQNVPVQPRAVQLDIASDSLPLAFDGIHENETTALEEMHRVAKTELGIIGQRGDGTFFFENRQKRGRGFTNIQTFTNSMIDMELSRSVDVIYNRVNVSAYTRLIDADDETVLYALVTPQLVKANSSLVLFGPYRDPNQRTSKVGGMDMQAPVATTDYLGNAAQDGSGADLTGTLSVSASYTGAGVRFTVANPSTNTDIWVTKLQCRGRGIYIIAAITEAENEESRDKYGRNVLSIDMPYQSNLTVSTEVGLYLLGLWMNPRNSVRTFTFCANDSQEMMDAALNRDISDRIGIVETVTGLSTAVSGSPIVRGFFINGIRTEIGDAGFIFVTWYLAPSDTTSYWVLEQPGYSELNNTTRLAYSIFAGGHADVAHTDIHSDVAHGDSAHVDTHGDVVHDDTHGDAAHDDAAHTDTHGDVAHVDTAHADTHSDVVHTDAAHSDSHSDAAHVDTHTDVAHIDSPHEDSHTDTAHSDVAHTDTHTDVAHTDVGDGSLSDPPHGDHDDTSLHVDHDDIPHEDVHSDIAHSDTAHGDVAHADEAHEDVFHQDAHTDTAHSDTHNDTAHSDVPHSDTHSDVAHSDTLHSDTHSDVAHGDGGHSDVHNDTAHDDTHSDTAHSDVAHSDTHTDVAHQDITS